jgi:hypothetical protein
MHPQLAQKGNNMKESKTKAHEPTVEVPELSVPAGFLIIDLSKILTRFETVATSPVESAAKSNAANPAVRITIDVPIAAVKTGPIVGGNRGG